MTKLSTVSATRWKGVALGLAVALIGLIIWDGADRRAADATQPLVQSPQSSVKHESPDHLILASFNIHGGKGSDGVRSLTRTAELLADIDFAGLYEVKAMSGDADPNQVAALARTSDAGWLFAPTERRWWSDHFGNGLLYRIPVRSSLRVPLVNTRGKAYRNAILSTVQLQSTAVRIVAVHIDRENDRRVQLQAVIELFLGLQKPCLLMGDLNTIASDPLLEDLVSKHDVRSPLQESLEGRLPSQNIDWIFTRGLRTISVKLVENTASDHPLLKAELVPDEPD
ncbi:MAG: endonuclease/exonuclease/phosphatase family protein [Schlesneria sp.]